MHKRRLICLAAALTICGGAYHLTEPATASAAAFRACTDEQAARAAEIGEEYCGGIAVVYVECSPGILVITRIDCI